MVGSLNAWDPILRGCSIVAFSDNEGALSCTIRGTSVNPYGAAIVQETRDGFADEPSRDDSCEGLGAKVDVDFSALASSVLGAWGE